MMAVDGPRALDVDERRWLLRLARSTIDARLAGRDHPEATPPSGPLCEIRGAFVTLTADSVLRGCIGHVVGTEALWLSVRSNAINAAFRDPRFSPVTAEEMAGLTVEISALTPLSEISDPRAIEVGRHGLLVERGMARGLLLPQVAERYDWSPEEFLDQTCRKAGMEPGCWRSRQARISVFSAEVFSETDNLSP
jgi:AmmeMemoRadiSam system protein A